MKDKRLTIIIPSASLVIILGFVVSFYGLKSFGIQSENANFLDIPFSLAGIILCFGALIYQAKEYKHQIVHLFVWLVNF